MTQYIQNTYAIKGDPLRILDMRNKSNRKITLSLGRVTTNLLHNG